MHFCDTNDIIGCEFKTQVFYACHRIKFFQKIKTRAVNFLLLWLDERGIEYEFVGTIIYHTDIRTAPV